MSGKSESERAEADQGGAGVFPTAHLVWFDAESGETLEVEVLGAAAGAWIEDLLAQGFVASEPPDGRVARRRCRIEVSSART